MQNMLIKRGWNVKYLKCKFFSSFLIAANDLIKVEPLTRENFLKFSFYIRCKRGLTHELTNYAHKSTYIAQAQGWYDEVQIIIVLFK